MRIGSLSKVRSSYKSALLLRMVVSTCLCAAFTCFTVVSMIHLLLTEWLYVLVMRFMLGDDSNSFFIASICGTVVLNSVKVLY